MNRLDEDLINSVKHFATNTIDSWISSGNVDGDSWGVEILVAPEAGSDFTDASYVVFGYTAQGAENDEAYYIANADGKNIACLAKGMDSHEAVRLYQGALAHIPGIFPWGGAVCDNNYGLIVGVSGFKEDEDILVARTLRNFIVMWLDREGQAIIDKAREDKSIDKALRFTHVPSNDFDDGPDEGAE